MATVRLLHKAIPQPTSTQATHPTSHHCIGRPPNTSIEHSLTGTHASTHRLRRAALQNALDAMAKAHQPTVELEQTTYYYLAEAHAVYEKAKYIQVQVRDAIAVLAPNKMGLAGDDGHPRTPMET